MLSVDPGGCTGFASWQDGEFSTWEQDEPMQAITAVEFGVKEGNIDTLVIESFTITPKTADKTQGGSKTAIEMIGAMRWLTWSYGILFVEQSPAAAKKFAEPGWRKLRQAGWYKPGADHCKMASSHLLLYLCEKQLFDARIFLTPDPSSS